MITLRKSVVITFLIVLVVALVGWFDAHEHYSPERQTRYLRATYAMPDCGYAFSGVSEPGFDTAGVRVWYVADKFGACQQPWRNALAQTAGWHCSVDPIAGDQCGGVGVTVQFLPARHAYFEGLAIITERH